MEGLMRSSFLTGRQISAAAVAGIIALGPLTAAAEDYPYTGLFWLSVGGPQETGLDRRCALSFLDQRNDGSWAVYHVDLAIFTASKEIVYKKLAEGECSFTPATKVEACVATMDKSFPEGEGQTVYDVVTTTSPDQIDTVMVDAASSWETVMQDPTNGDAGYVLTYQRCPFPEEAMRSRISSDPTTVPAEELTALRFPSEDLVASPDVASLVTTLQGQ
jgi:hypothetical protein